MIVLQATPELRVTFTKLIQTMEAPVSWNGLFVVIDNTLILKGEVRSLFFHFDSRKVVTNLIDLEIPMQKIKTVNGNPYVTNSINMLLYAFGKWGTIKGLKVEKDYRQLSQLLANILNELEIEAEYTQEHFWFFQNGVRIVYEDVVQCALEQKERAPQGQKEESRGLWHKLIWKHVYKNFGTEETTVKERNRNRLGNNFYLTGFLCPVCESKMHGVVYPVGKEFIIDTEEGQVRLARAYTCSACCSFYTPRPEQLLIDGDCYLMDFAGDVNAYEDYQELLGKNGARVCNYNFNEYVHRRTKAAALGSREELPKLSELKDVPEVLEHLSDRDLERLLAAVEEGFYPQEKLEALERTLWKEQRMRRKSGKKKKRTRKEKEFIESRRAVLKTEAKVAEDTDAIPDVAKEAETDSENGNERLKLSAMKGKAPGMGLRFFEKEQTLSRDSKKAAEKEARYKTRLKLFPRLSERQRNELVAQISSDAFLDEQVRERLLDAAKQLKRKDSYEQLKEKVRNARNKNRLVMLRVYGEILDADIDETEQQELLGLSGLKKRDYELYQQEQEAESRSKTVVKTPAEDAQAAEEGKENQQSYEIAEQEAEKAKPVLAERMAGVLNIERKQTKKPLRAETVWTEQIDSAAGKERKAADKQEKRLTPVKKTKKRQITDLEEVQTILLRTGEDDRESLQDILNHLLSGEFPAREAEPYIEEVKAKIRKLDEDYIDEILGDYLQMNGEEGTEAYEKLLEADLLPELKTEALKQLEERLAKIKSEECELLVQKLQKEMKEAQIEEPKRHYYYPAKKVVQKEASPEETQVIDFAMASYGAGLGPFEYPIWLVDTSRNQSGDRGMFLTPEQLYYSTFMTSYRMSVFSIDRIEAAAGLWNKGLYVYQKDGTKTKLPYAVEGSDLPKLAEVLQVFIKYLQEKPFSRKESYLAKEKHETICCFRCGYVYKDLDACPKCGFKTNE